MQIMNRTNNYNKMHAFNVDMNAAGSGYMYSQSEIAN